MLLLGYYHRSFFLRPFSHIPSIGTYSGNTRYVVVVVFFTLTDRASTIPSSIRDCQPGTWSQRGTQTNRDPNRDKKLRDSTSNGTDQYQNGSSNLLTPCIESSLDRLGLLSPTHDQRSQQQIGHEPVLINKSKFLKVTHRTKIRKIKIPGSMVVEALSW